MHKRFVCVAVVAVVWGGACASRSKGAEPGEPESVTSESSGAGARSAVDCRKELTIDVDPDGADGSNSKRFEPRPDPQWTVCDTGTLKVKNELSYALCLDIVDSSGNDAITPMSLPVSTDSQDVTMPAPGSGYTLGVCKQRGTGCTGGCTGLTGTAQGADTPDTIKGNLSVVTSG